MSEEETQDAGTSPKPEEATEGEESVPSVTLTTAAWLTKIESLPREETMPGNIASELAKKSIEWKRETQNIISRYI